MKIGIIDADLLRRNKHRFPNLVSMKLSGYHKEKGDEVTLLLDYENLEEYDIVYVSKVFTDTVIDKEVLELPNVKYGGTGFYYDKAEPLPYEIEHHMPDYHLYDEWVTDRLEKGENKNNFEYYLNYSIGFTTRGCFRQCQFCVNRNYKRVYKHSPVEEFLDKDRKYICLLDDNILGFGGWREIFEELNATGKRFQYKQGMDERILTQEKCEVILKSKYKGEYYFAFDNIEDKDIIVEKLKLWNKNKTSKGDRTRFYVFCGFDRKDKYDEEFYVQDIIDTFERVSILMRYKSLPYIMRHENYKNSPYRGMYINLARWCNQPTFFRKKSFREFCIFNGENSACYRYMVEFEKEHPEIAKEYFDIKYDDIHKNIS